MQEAGVPNFDLASWTAFVYPAGVPAGAAARLNTATNKALNRPEIRARLLELGADPSLRLG